MGTKYPIFNKNVKKDRFNRRRAFAVLFHINRNACDGRGEKPVAPMRNGNGATMTEGVKKKVKRTVFAHAHSHGFGRLTGFGKLIFCPRLNDERTSRFGQTMSHASAVCQLSNYTLSIVEGSWERRFDADAAAFQRTTSATFAFPDIRKRIV